MWREESSEAAAKSVAPIAYLPNSRLFASSYQNATIAPVRQEAVQAFSHRCCQLRHDVCRLSGFCSRELPEFSVFSFGASRPDGQSFLYHWAKTGTAPCDLPHNVSPTGACVVSNTPNKERSHKGVHRALLAMAAPNVPTILRSILPRKPHCRTPAVRFLPQTQPQYWATRVRWAWSKEAEQRRGKVSLRGEGRDLKRASPRGRS